MSKVSKFIGRALHFLDVQIGDISRKEDAIKLLRDNLGLDKTEAVKIYRLWYFNKGQDDYYNVEEESESTLLEFIKTISEMSAGEIDSYTDDLYDMGMLDKLLGPDFNGNCGGWNSSTPCISFKRDGIQLELDRDGWENYFSGLGDDDLWYYYNAHSSYSDYYEDVDSEEFNYVYTDEKTIEHLKTLAILAGKDDWPGKDGGIEHNEVNDFLSEILPPENYERIVDDYLGEFSIVLTKSRIEAARYCYERDVKYNTNNTSCESGDYCIFIPYDDLTELIDKYNLIHLSELKNQNINGDINLSDCWYDGWVDSEGVDDCIIELNRSLKNTIEKLSEDVDLEELIRQRTEMVNMLDKMGFLKYTKTSKGDYYKSKDGKIDLHTNDINYKDSKIKFSYEGKQHLIPIEEFPNWVYGTPLDLNESVRVDKKLLKELTDNINKISIFDFDGTLMDTPDSKEGKKQWEEFKGEKYPHIGWWSKPESLDDAVFDIQPIESTVSDYKNEMDNPNTFVIMLTGRLPHQSEQIEELLALHNIHFKEYHYKSNGDTLTSKINTIKSLLNRFPEVNEIEMWEDREPHAIAFEEWGKENGVNIKVNIVKKNDITINESVGERNEIMYKKVASQLTPPYIYNLTSMAFSLSEAEKILSIKYGKRVYIKDNSEFVSPLSVSDPDMFEVEDTEGILLYYEDQQYPTNITWSKWEYDDRGNEIYFESSGGYWRRNVYNEFNERVYSENSKGVIRRRNDEDLNESENKQDKFYKKITEILTTPYFYNLESMGINNVDEQEKILSIVFNEPVKIYQRMDVESNYDLIVTNLNDDEVYFEGYGTTFWEKTKYDSKGNIIYFENSNGIWEKTKYDSKGNKIYYENSNGKWFSWEYHDNYVTFHTYNGETGTFYDHSNDNPETSDDLNESISREKMYLDKVSQLINPPYINDLATSAIPFKDWVKVLSLIFGRDVIMDGESNTKTNILDANTLKILYSEWYNGNWHNFLTWEYSIDND